MKIDKGMKIISGWQLCSLTLLIVGILYSEASWAGNLYTEKSAKVLTALKKCPAKEPICIVFNIYLNWPGKSSGRITDHPNVVKFVPDDEFGDYGTAHINVRGRLKGGPEKTFRLLLRYPTDMLECGEFYAATIGVSGSVGGTVLTDAGHLEIVDETLRFGDRSSVDFIDKSDLSVSSRLAPGWERYSWGAEPIVTKSGNFYLKKQDHCISVEKPGLFELIPADKCVPLAMDDVSPPDMEKVGKANVFGKSATGRLKYDLYQPRGAPFLVRIWGVACT